MTKEELKPIPPKELSDLDLLELVCQLHSRALNQPDSREMHDAYIEAREEMESRLKDKEAEIREVAVEFAKHVKNLPMYANYFPPNPRSMQEVFNIWYAKHKDK